jgi:hypothetical protein
LAKKKSASDASGCLGANDKKIEKIEVDQDDENFLKSIKDLLFRVFNSEIYRSVDYVNWQYREAPEGRQISQEIWHEGKCLAHYCVVPQKWSCRERGVVPFALSLNTAVGAEARGKGVFTTLAESTYNSAISEHGIEAIIGVANANSTPGFLRKLGFKLVAPLPVRMGITIPMLPEGVRFWSISNGQLPEDLKPTLDLIAYEPSDAWSRAWSSESLAWRLRSPVRSYNVHADKTGLLISTIDHFHGIPVSILLRHFRLDGQQWGSSQRLIKAACAVAGTPFFLHAGFTRTEIGFSIPLPRGLLPSPLNLIYRPLSGDTLSHAEFKINEFEFLDFDAY